MASPRILLCVVVAALLGSCFPISNDGLWWDLARGRAVCNGDWQPSRVLLGELTANESDWLAGVPTFLAHSIAEGSGLMLWKLGCSIAVAVILIRAVPQPTVNGACIIVLMLIALRAAWDDASLMMDVFGVFALRFHVMRRTVHPRWTGFVSLALLFLIWTNISLRILLACLALVISFVPLLWNSSLRSWAVLAILLTGCAVIANPRGLLVFQDSFALTWPQYFESSLILQLAGWQSLFGRPLDPASIAFLVLTVTGFVCLCLTSTSCWEFTGFVLVTLSAFFSTTNIPFATAWIACTILLLMQKGSLTPIDRFVPLFVRQKFPAVCLASCLALAFSAGSGMWPGGLQRFGWGIHPRLEIRLCEQALQDIQTTGKVWCSDIRAAGMIAWLRPGSLLPEAPPGIALLRGQLRERILCQDDLRNSRRAWYLREDESTGGWWIPLVKSNTRLLVISNEDRALIHALEPTIWKPLSLDSPVIPFGMAGDPAVNDRIIEVLQQKDFVELGPWSFVPPLAVGNDTWTDIWGMLTGRPDQTSALQQARVFQAMNMPFAALRVLIPLLKQPGRHPDVHVEFARCQFQLAYDEQQLLSYPSQWRQLICRSVKYPAGVFSPGWKIEVTPQAGLFHAQMQQAAELYISGDPAAAISVLTAEDPAVLYARACLLMESGRSSECVDLLTQLLQTFPESSTAIVSQDVLSRLSP